jgi:hypothetical protein
VGRDDATPDLAFNQLTLLSDGIGFPKKFLKASDSGMGAD